MGTRLQSNVQEPTRSGYVLGQKLAEGWHARSVSFPATAGKVRSQHCRTAPIRLAAIALPITSMSCRCHWLPSPNPSPFVAVQSSLHLQSSRHPENLPNLQRCIRSRCITTQHAHEIPNPLCSRACGRGALCNHPGEPSSRQPRGAVRAGASTQANLVAHQTEERI